MAKKKQISPEQIERLRQASRVFVREQGVLRAEQPGSSLTYARGHAMIELERHQQLTVGQLAENLGLNKSSTSRTLKQLRDKGWVEVQSDPHDERRKPFVLTPAGKKRLALLHKEVNERVTKALSLLSLQEQEQVLEGMELYAHALQQAAGRLKSE